MGAKENCGGAISRKTRTTRGAANSFMRFMCSACVGRFAGKAEGELSCSSCHKTFNPIDRETPRTTCGDCHNGRVDPGSNRVLIAKDKPNCTSCHVQHVKDKRHWNPSLMAEIVVKVRSRKSKSKVHSVKSLKTETALNIRLIGVGPWTLDFGHLAHGLVAAGSRLNRESFLSAQVARQSTCRDRRCSSCDRPLRW